MAIIIKLVPFLTLLPRLADRAITLYLNNRLFILHARNVSKEVFFPSRDRISQTFAKLDFKQKPVKLTKFCVHYAQNLVCNSLNVF